MRRLPTQLSGGEQQRVAIARAVVTRPGLIVADEPTGSLDQESGRVVFDLLAGLVGAGNTVLLITHDKHLANRADRTVSMLDGRVERSANSANSASSESSAAFPKAGAPRDAVAV